VGVFFGFVFSPFSCLCRCEITRALRKSECCVQADWFNLN